MTQSSDRHPHRLARSERQPGSFLERAARLRSQLIRRASPTTEAILRAQQEAMLDGILVVDTAGKVLSYNRRFLEIWGIPENTASESDDNRLLGYAADAVADWEGFIELVHYLYLHPHEARTGDSVLLRDGRILMRATVPVLTDGQVAGRAWYFRDVSEQRRAEVLQSALFRIAQVSREAENLDSFYASIHRIVGELMDATNFYIAEHDPVRDVMQFPYFIDEFDPAPHNMPPGNGLTAYVLRTGEPLLVRPELFKALVASKEVDEVGAPSVDWLGVPLRTGNRTWGVMGVQTYDERTRYNEKDRDILIFVAQHVASAIDQLRKDEALRNSERRYRQMFENNRAVQLVIDPNSGSIVDANVAAADFYGYTIEQLRSLRMWDINVSPEDKVRQEMSSARSQERNYFIFRHRRANGEIRDVEVHSGPVDIGDRRLLYSIIHDVTERKRAELALRQSEEKYRDIFNFASVGIYQSTIDGKLLTANATLARMLGYDSVEELLSVDVPTDIYSDAGERETLIRKFEPKGIANDYEVLWKKKDGSPIWVQLNAHRIPGPGDSYYFEGFVYDVTERKQARESVTAANAQRKAVLDAATRVAVIATDPSGTITVFNSGAERLLGYSADEVIGRKSILDIYLPDEVAQHADGLEAEFHRTFHGFDVLITRAAILGLEEREWTYLDKNGERFAALVSVTALRADDRSITGFLHVGTDVTERKRAEAMLRRQSAAMTASMDGIAILNEKFEFNYVNDALAKLYGFANPEAMMRSPVRHLYEPAEIDRFGLDVLPLVQERGRWRGEANGRRRDGSTFPQEISLTAIDGGGLVCVVRDITERTYAEEQIKHLAYHDALTGCPNRLLFKDRLTVALSHAQRDKKRLAILFLDLDRFKVINDSLGHNFGDQLLQAVAARLESCVRLSDTVARLGGDEFTLLLPDLAQSEDAAPIAQKLLEAIRQPFHIEGREFLISTSVGISLFPEDGTDAETLIKNADTAMYQAKEQGRDNYQLFNASINEKALQRISLENGLRRALFNSELEVHYQPIYDLRANRITGMEALLRWTNPDLGSIPPSVFIPIAEANGTMVPIGTWVMRSACFQAKAWHDVGFKHLSLAVNLSVCQLQQPDLLQVVKEILTETGLPARMLELEITESSAMQSPETSIRTLYELKKLGVRISLDDFGTGHSSLSYLKRFPVDTLKIDQSFVRDITSDPDTAAIVTGIIAMAHSLRLKVIAEGVEFSEQSTFLKRYGCDQMQGYLIKRPVSAAAFLELLAQPAIAAT
jgi:diguanylate cyclase (GGDEF)-like protein/PAS domain S-box-containing protein